jgi:5-methylcytosine-specific restriction endonuclease McrA
MSRRPINWPYEPVGSAVARAILNYIRAHGGGGVQDCLDYERYATDTEFSIEEIQAGFGHLVVRGLARINGNEVLLLTPQILQWEAEKREQAEARAAKRSAKVALRGGKVNRATIPEDVRAAVYVRDGGVCQKCGTDKNLTMDHKHPWSLGGPDTVENLQVLCRSCNSSKGDRA